VSRKLVSYSLSAAKEGFRVAACDLIQPGGMRSRARLVTSLVEPVNFRGKGNSILLSLAYVFKF
jgi:hypothetical protein